MFKMLIVEDERWEREGLIEFLDWASMGISVIETAADGIEGDWTKRWRSGRISSSQIYKCPAGMESRWPSLFWSSFPGCGSLC